jgi:hypothetical protein
VSSCFEDGATLEDLISTERIGVDLKDHAQDIYQYMNSYDFNSIFVPDGSLYVLTGCDKVSAYKLALSQQSLKRQSLIGGRT